MHKKYVYSSVFSNLLDDYISAHREAGFMYDNPAYWLYRFDQYCDEKQVKVYLSTEKWFFPMLVDFA